jgi:cytidyltransferase-like protein
VSIVNLDHFGGSYYADKRYVLVGGCFDPLHEGHLEYFRQARCFGPLVCAIAPDAEIAAKRTPCLPELTRLKVLDHCDQLDHVHLAVHGIVPVLEELRPLAYVKGADWIGKLPAEQIDACDRLGIPIHYLPSVEQSSTRLLDSYQRRLNVSKLAAFETFVQQQRPAEKPWEPVTDYSFEAREAIEGPHALLIKETLRPRHVLDVGCGADAVLVRMLADHDVRAEGIDPSEPGYTNWGDGVSIHGDIVAMDFSFNYTHDVVICREVLEHLTVRHLAIAVRNLVKLSTKYVYVTTRFTAKSHLHDADGSDDLDPTHITMLNQDYLRSLFVLEGCTRRADLEAKLDWRGLGRVLVYEVSR